MIFAPGCALYVYKKDLADKLYEFLNKKAALPMYLTCCTKEPEALRDKPSQMITVCSGCNRRYSSLYKGITAITLWELIDSMEDFPFPDYKGWEITVHDACPTRNKPHVHKAVRSLLKKMNFTVIEAEKSGENAVCCGDSFYGSLPKEELYKEMKKRANSMPVSDVAVYCVSCIKSLANGGKKPRYMVDLLFNEETVPGECDPDLWHNSIKEFAL